MIKPAKMIRTIDGDITSIKVDAIVNAANSSLLGGGGVDGAIHRVGGHAILEDCMRIHEKQGGCQVGEAVITTAGRLPAKYVIHAVGPVWLGGNGQEDFLLAKAYRNSLRLAVEYQLRSIAFPNISTGMYHYPKERAASIAIMAVSGFLQQPGTLREVIFVCFDPENSKLYADILGE